MEESRIILESLKEIAGDADKELGDSYRSTIKELIRRIGLKREKRVEHPPTGLIGGIYKYLQEQIESQKYFRKLRIVSYASKLFDMVPDNWMISFLKDCREHGLEEAILLWDGSSVSASESDYSGSPEKLVPLLVGYKVKSK